MKELLVEPQRLTGGGAETGCGAQRAGAGGSAAGGQCWCPLLIPLPPTSRDLSAPPLEGPPRGPQRARAGTVTRPLKDCRGNYGSCWEAGLVLPSGPCLALGAGTDAPPLRHTCSSINSSQVFTEP